MSELDTSGSVEGLGRATSPVYSTTVNFFFFQTLLRSLTRPVTVCRPKVTLRGQYAGVTEVSLFGLRLQDASTHPQPFDFAQDTWACF